MEFGRHVRNPIDEAMDKLYSRKTAIYRNKPSAPARWLDGQGLLFGRLLDFGCGRGMDAMEYDMAQYDPWWYPTWPTGKFDTITCTYVLNVIPEEKDREEVIQEVRGLLNPGGRAYFAVRNDTRNLNGWTSAGTWQGYVEPEGLRLLTEQRGFRIYELENRPQPKNNSGENE